MPSPAEALALLRRRYPVLTEDGPPRIVVIPGGPLVACGVPTIDDYLGCPIRPDPSSTDQVDDEPVTALCRCGAAGSKPRCDATCLQQGFDDSLDPGRVPDRRDRYDGVQVTVLDNRGLCQHSGLCTDRLATVFHADSEPFVTPSGGRMDEIIRAVRDCPSGALAFAVDGVDGVDADEIVDWSGTRPPVIEVTRDGPYRITGSVPVVRTNGDPVSRVDGASTEHYALCRCGQSRNKPFCSGMHWYVGFRDPLPEPDAVPTIFEWAGGLPALTRLTRLFYERYVAEDELLAPLFGQMSPEHPQHVARWLAEVFGGPKMYSDELGGYDRMLGQHRGRALSEEQRTRWVELLMRSARDAGLPNDPEFRAAFGAYIEWGSRLAFENSGADARPPEHMPMPRWDWTTAAGPPGSRMSALVARAAPAAADVAVLALPADGEPVSFTRHVKGLFRSRDRTSMLFAFDLWSYDDVRTAAEAILDRVRAGTMPCDGRWPADQVELFQRWITDGLTA